LYEGAETTSCTSGQLPCHRVVHLLLDRGDSNRLTLRTYERSIQFRKCVLLERLPAGDLRTLGGSHLVEDRESNLRRCAVSTLDHSFVLTQSLSGGVKTRFVSVLLAANLCNLRLSVLYCLHEIRGRI